MIGAFTFIAFDNTSLRDDFTTVPVQIYNWTIRPQEAFQQNAAAAIIVLMVAIFSPQPRRGRHPRTIPAILAPAAERQDLRKVR